ncbi:MAG: phospholipase D-like domain-containing protein [Porticoccaceae bacterium]
MIDAETGGSRELSGRNPVLVSGRNFWKYERASRLATIVDTADYFAAFAEACRAAERQILILGWDFDRQERLHRGDPDGDFPDKLGEFLVTLVKQKPDLHVYLLLWDFNMIYAAERELLPALRLRLQTPPRFHFRLDDKHPKGASHHQKVVVIDDRIAFVGGIDLSRWRWDTAEHAPDDPRRIDSNGKAYPPFHDMMMLVEGIAARRLGELARERWRRLCGRRITAPAGVQGCPWPNSIAAELEGVDIAIARTEPAYRGRNEVREVERLYIDAIASARETIYIENQYFTAHVLADALAERLAEEHGPEVILILPEQTGGWLEQVTMDVVRGRIMKRLHDVDQYDRLRVYFPYQPGLGDTCISVHAKLLIVDDHLLRIGSSNTSNRSMGLDTECDLALESRQANDRIAGYIHGLRSRLLAEHLACTPEDVTRAIQQEGSTIRAIDSLRSDQRSLRPLDCSVPENVDEMVPDSYLIDPAEPFSVEYFVEAYVPVAHKSPGRRRLLIFAIIVLLLLGLAAAWRWTPLLELLSPERVQQYLASISSFEVRTAVAIGGFIIASLLMVPLTLLAVIGGVVFGGWQAFAYVLTGAMGASAIGFFGGRLLGHGLLKRLSGSRIEQLSKRLTKRGTIAVAILRLVPVAPFAIFNLIAGSSHLGARQFLVGSLIGLAPGLGAITLFSNSLWEALTAPSLVNSAIAVVLGGALILLVWLAKRWLRTS